MDTQPTMKLRWLWRSYWPDYHCHRPVVGKFLQQWHEEVVMGTTGPAVPTGNGEWRDLEVVDETDRTVGVPHGYPR